MYQSHEFTFWSVPTQELCMHLLFLRAHPAVSTCYNNIGLTIATVSEEIWDFHYGDVSECELFG
jgi:hypothetical protein